MATSYGLPALHINPPPPQESPISQIGQILALKNQIANAPLQRQALQQQLQSGDLENQQKQQALKDQQAATAAMQEWDGKDINALAPLMIKKGASAQAVMGLKSKALEMQQTYSKIAADDATTGQKNIETRMKKNDMIGGAFSTVLQAPDDQLPQAITSTAQQLAQQGLLDPQHLQMAQQIASQPPAQARMALETMRKGMLADSQLLEQAKTKAQTAEFNANAQNARGKIDPTSPLYAPSPSSVAMGTAPGAAQIQAGEVKQAAAKAGAEAAAKQPYEMALARQRQALSQGDPRAAAQLLVDGDATLSELKSRGATPEFIAKTLFNAKQLSKGEYNAQTADAQFKVAQSPAQVQFFGSAKSLTDKGGTLDQLAETAKKIPQNQLPVLNSLEDWAKVAAGSGPLAEYASRVLGVADDYAKVMGGGVGSDTSRLQAANLISAKLSKEGRDGAIAGIRGSVHSQIGSRIGDNKVLQRMYGSQQPEQQQKQGAPLKITLPSGKQISIE